MKGTILRGSLSGGLEVRLDIGENIEEIKVGTFCVVEGRTHDFFSMVVDEDIEAANPKAFYETLSDNPLLNEVVRGTGIIDKVKIQPMIAIRREDNKVQPVKSIPSYLSRVREAREEDVFKIFGRPDRTHFHVGSPLDMDHIPVCIDLKKFIERSNGIFGKSGTGKTFYTRIMLCGMIKSGLCNVLVFDMHSEYGWEGEDEDETRKKAKGLKQLFGSKVAIFTLDPESSRNRGVHPDFVVEIPYRSIEAEDIVMVREELNLNPTALEVIYVLQKHLGQDWLITFLNMDAFAIEEFAENTGAHAGALQALQRKLFRLQKLPFIKENPADDAVERIMQYLDSGMNVVLEFGHQRSMLAYMLVANILTRRIHEMYVKRSEKALGGMQSNNTPLVIVIEEAHKFLSPEMSRQTIFGMIAREMRKYNVTLLVVDQRPSGIDPEVMSQLGTKIVALLTEEKDIESVLCGVNNARMLRNVLASLDTKQQAIIMGHAVPMPVVIRTRTYDETFYKEITKDEDDAFRRRLLPRLNQIPSTGTFANGAGADEPPPGKEFEDLMKELYGL
ncbi:MAG: ATP-binding protein [Clostridia bacterium]